jgi:hypothetical protein
MTLDNFGYWLNGVFTGVGAAFAIYMFVTLLIDEHRFKMKLKEEQQREREELFKYRVAATATQKKPRRYKQ